MAKPMWAGFVSAILLAFICVGVYAFNERSHVAEAQSATIVGVDANPAGNTATSLGAINSCIWVNLNDTFSIDLFIQDVTNLNSFDGTFRFDGSVLEVNSLDATGFFLGSNVYPILECYSGQCQVSNVDTTGAGHTDKGVLGRLELTAIGTGISKANFDLRPDGLPISGVYLLDNGSPPAPIGDLDSDGSFDGDILNAEIRVAVDEPCPGECLPDTDTDGDGFDDDVECYLETDPLDDCPNNPNHDAWPLDIDASGDISVTGDIFYFVGRLGAQSPANAYCPGPQVGNWLQRLDFDASCDISITGDVFLYVGRIGDTCS